MRLICEEYSKEKPNDSEETKQKRFDKISELMLKVGFIIIIFVSVSCVSFN